LSKALSPLIFDDQLSDIAGAAFGLDGGLQLKIIDEKEPGNPPVHIV
jgi:hypothetical protein